MGSESLKPYSSKPVSIRARDTPMPEWITLAVSVASSLIGSFIGVRVSVTRLEVQMMHIKGLAENHDATLHHLEKRVGTMEGDVERMKVDIGTHDSGMRGELHAHNNMLAKHELRLHALDKYPLQEI
jgi:hypothetical protein